MSDDPYVIRHAGRWPTRHDALPPVLLTVSTGVGEVFRFAVTMAGTAAVAFRDLSTDGQGRILAEAGLDDLEAGLRAGIYPPHEGDAFERMFTSDDVERLERYRDRQKRCAWQERQPRGWFCAATAPAADPRTTDSLCRRCPIPDERVICAQLVHPSIELLVSRDETVRVPALAPLCNLGNDPGTGEGCRPGALACWQRLVETRALRLDPPTDAARRAADEIDFLTLVYRDRYGGRLWTIPQARTISELFGDCESAEDFQRRVAALADLLSQLDPYGQLGEQARVGADGRRVGPLVALERLMQRDHPEAMAAVRRLREIPAARNQFPIHTRNERLRDALRALGVDFPASDWRLAWLRVLTAFWSSLETIRGAIQTGAAREDAEGGD